MYKYNCPVRWYAVVDEICVDEMSVDDLSWNRSCLNLSRPPVTSHLMSSHRAISITSPRLWNDLPPELRAISLPPPPSLSITRHPSPLSVTPGSGVQRVLNAWGQRGAWMPHMSRNLFLSIRLQIF